MDDTVTLLLRQLKLDPSDETLRRRLHTMLGRQGWGQCDPCGGLGEDVEAGNLVSCTVCNGVGALPQGHTKIRKCAEEGCRKPLLPAWVAVYCSGECAWRDAV